MKKYYPFIGLEIHAELKTLTKMFCNSKNDPDEKRPNVNICPVCMAHPGVLPVINKQAVIHVLRVSHAVGGKIADFSEFDRKNYFYPDIPKGYQISQYKYPLVSGGSLNGVKITRIHLEEDTAKLYHCEDEKESLIDFNRAGVPLMELVTEPVIKSAKEAGDFARELQLLLRYLGVSEANMEKGEMRVEANVSISPKEGELGTKVEVKNLNSFRAVEKAVEFELKRLEEMLEKGEVVEQETRGWNEFKGETFSQRKKETSQDYGYFPDPDLPKLWISKVAEFSDLVKTLPELPSQKRERLLTKYGLRAEAVEIFVGEKVIAEFFEKVIAEHKNDNDFVALVSNYITSDMVSLMKKSGVVGVADEAEVREGAIKILPAHFAGLIEMIQKGELSSRGAKDVLAKMFERGTAEPKKTAEELGVIQKNDEASVGSVAEEILSENPEMVASYKTGKVAVLQFLIGQAMKKLKGAGNPQMLSEVFKKMLK